MDTEVWAWRTSAKGGTVRLTLARPGVRPVVAKLTEAEFERVAGLLDPVAESVRRGEFSRVRLGAAFRAAIGRDPFRPVRSPSAGLVAWWLDCAYVVIGLGFASGAGNWWWRAAGWAFAAVAVADLAGHGVRRLRRQDSPGIHG